MTCTGGDPATGPMLPRHARSGRRAVLCLALTWLAVASARSGLPSTPELQWAWRGAERSPDHPRPVSTPVVAQLTDDDGDGVLSGADTPDLAFLHHAEEPDATGVAVSALSGDDGSAHFTVSRATLAGTLGVADLDDDGAPELLLYADDASPLAEILESDGSYVRTLRWPSPPSEPITNWHPIGLADLDQDGVAELLSARAVRYSSSSYDFGASVVSVDRTLEGSEALRHAARGAFYGIANVNTDHWLVGLIQPGARGDVAKATFMRKIGQLAWRYQRRRPTKPGDAGRRLVPIPRRHGGEFDSAHAGVDGVGNGRADDAKAADTERQRAAHRQRIDSGNHRASCGNTIRTKIIRTSIANIGSAARAM